MWQFLDEVTLERLVFHRVSTNKAEMSSNVSIHSPDHVYNLRLDELDITVVTYVLV